MHFIESPINYMGSKYHLLPYLIQLFPEVDTFYDVFTGGGSVYMNIANRYKHVVANDWIGDLVKIHKQLGNTDFIAEAAKLSQTTKHSQESYLALREQYNADKNPAALLALIWSCNSNMMRFNQDLRFNQTWGKRCYNDSTHRRWELYKQKSYTNVIFENKHFGDYKKIANKNAFLYLDPPYSNTEAGYNIFWSKHCESELITMVEGFIAEGIPFGLSGVLNEKVNVVYNALRHAHINIYYFGDMYQKISKKQRVNVEYYITNAPKELKHNFEPLL